MFGHSAVSYSLGTFGSVACQAPLSVGFPRQEYWSRCFFLLQEIFLNQGSNSHLLCLLHCGQILYSLSHWRSLNASLRGTMGFPGLSGERIHLQCRRCGFDPWVEEGTAIHSNILVWRVPWTEEPVWATVHRVAKSQTWLKPLSTHTCIRRKQGAQKHLTFD